MPVMVVGADTPEGNLIVMSLVQPEREVRAFVTDPQAAADLRRVGVKVAVGDVSDESHIAGACLNCFTVVLVGRAATDDRPRAFARSEEEVLSLWASGVTSAGVARVIWVHDDDPPAVAVPEMAVADPARSDLVEEVCRLDDVAVL